MEAAVLEPFTARDGENLALYDWISDNSILLQQGDAAPPPRAVVLIVHGFGEHAMRYEPLVRKLLDWGFVVRSYDQRGHGESGGRRGALPDEFALLDDLAEVIDDTRERYRRARGLPATPLVLLGHSLGGLVASRLVALKMRPVDGLVLSSPALKVDMGPVKKLLLYLGMQFAPNLRVGSGLDAHYLSHDPKVVGRYRLDRHVHSKVSPRLGQFIAAAGPSTIEAAANWTMPTLLMYAGADRLVNAEGSRAFAANAHNSPAVKPGTVTEKCFDDLYHEIFNELGASHVFQVLESWLDAHF